MFLQRKFPQLFAIPRHIDPTNYMQTDQKLWTYEVLHQTIDASNFLLIGVWTSFSNVYHLKDPPSTSTTSIPPFCLRIPLHAFLESTQIVHQF